MYLYIIKETQEAPIYRNLKPRVNKMKQKKKNSENTLKSNSIKSEIL